LHSLYFKRFREYFLERTVRTVEATLAGLPPSQDPRYDYKSVYDNVKGYKTITTSEESRCPPDNEFAAWVVGSWRGNDLVERQFSFYVDELRAKRDPYPDLRSSPQAIRSGRAYLAAYHGIDPIYNQIISSVNQEAQAVARLSDYTARAKETLVLKAGADVPAAFTRTGWELVQKRIAGADLGTSENSCVVGLARSVTGLFQGTDTKRQLTNRYIQDYIDHWRTFLASTTVQGYTNQADAARKLELLSGNDSPLLAVLAMTAENTKLTQDASAAKNALAEAESKAKRGVIDRLLRRTPAALKNQVPASQPAEALRPEKISGVFQPAQVVFRSPNRQRLIDEVNTKYVAALSDLQGSMTALAQQSNPQSNVELNNRANEKAQAALREAKQLSMKFDSSPESVGETVATFLEAPIRATSPLIVSDFEKAAKGKVDGGLRDFCAKLQKILRKYPFSSQATQEVSLEELQAIFAPTGGAFWGFHREFTAKLLEQHGRQWLPKPDAETKLNDRFLVFFNRMARVSNALFQPDGEVPRMQYKLSLLPGSGYQSIKGSVDDQEFTSTVRQYTWPAAPGQKRGVDLRVTPAGTNATVPFDRHEGFWGLFRWMQGAEDHTGGPSVFGFVNQARATPGSQPQPILENGAAIRIQVDEFPGSIENVFDRDFFTGIDCPMRATQ
jgi:type VI secretion system protein ImpL